MKSANFTSRFSPGLLTGLKLSLGLAPCLALSAFAADMGSKTDTPAGSTTAASMANPSTAPKMTDGQIASIMKTANEAEISAAKMAKGKAQNADVKSFATHMIVDHRTNEKQGELITRKNSIRPEPSETMQAMKSDALAKTNDLRSKNGTDFDKGYIDLQVAMHQQLLTDLDEKFIPATQNAELKTFLQTTKTHVQEHLAQAQKIQSSLVK